jgi:hypothetical protein
MVRVDEAPALIEVGVAETFTVGAAGVPPGSLESVPDFAPPHPASVRKSDNSTVAAKGAAIL